MKHKNNITGLESAFVLGDIHGNIVQFERAVQFARERNLMIVSLGDLTDYGHENFKCVQLMHKLVTQDLACMVIGNHDFKFKKWIDQGREGTIRVEVKRGLLNTVTEYEALNSDKQNEMLDKFDAIYDNSSFIYHEGNTMFIHAGVHPTMWHVDELNGKLRSRAIYGQVDGYNENNYPNRIYDWAELVPSDNSVFIGHDIINIDHITKIGQLQNVFSLDTGSSKGGKLSGVVVEKTNGRFMPVSQHSFDK